MSQNSCRFNVCHYAVGRFVLNVLGSAFCPLLTPGPSALMVLPVLTGEVVLSCCCDSQEVVRVQRLLRKWGCWLLLTLPALCSGFLYCTLHTLGTASMAMLGKCKLHWDVSPNLWVVCFYLGNEIFWGHVCNPKLCLNSEFFCVALRCWDHRVPVLAAKLNVMKNWATLKLLYLFVCLFGFP